MANVTTVNGVRVIEANTATLLGKVLWITTAGFVFTGLGTYLAPQTLGLSLIVIFLLNLGLIFAIQAASRRSSGLALALFYIFTTLMGVQISPLLNQYLHTSAGQTIVFEAAITTALGMAVMAIIAQVASFNYQKVGRIAIYAVGGLIIIGLISAFVHFISPGIYAWLTLIIFSVLLLVDFMRLRDQGQAYGAVPMALSIYLDAINIFIALLQIFGGGRRRD